MLTLPAFVQQDPNHLLTVGEEGFFGFSDPADAAKYNPNADATDYAIKAGQVHHWRGLQPPLRARASPIQ